MTMALPAAAGVLLLYDFRQVVQNVLPADAGVSQNKGSAGASTPGITRCRGNLPAHSALGAVLSDISRSSGDLPQKDSISRGYNTLPATAGPSQSPQGNGP